MTPGRMLAGLAILALIAPVAHADIDNIHAFLEQCPTSDPAYAQIRQDFTILRNGAPVGALACTGPISLMPIGQYTDELILVQGLRVLYYMDRGRANHLPWTSVTLYDWMKSRVRGFNLSDTAGSSSCCVLIGGEHYPVIRTQDAFNRDFDRTWRGIAGNIGLYAHEARHRDGFPHDSGCGIIAGCDPEYNESSLTSYGIQWWLDAHWLSGDLYVGFACAAPATVSAIVSWHLSGANSTFRSRFSSQPPPLLATPPQPGGGCRATGAAGMPVNVQALATAGVLVVSWQAPASGAAPTGYRVDFSQGATPVHTVTVGAASSLSLQIPSGVAGAFTVRVTALAPGGAGPASAPAAFTIGAAPCVALDPPAGLTGTLSGGVGSVSWLPVANATSYVVLAGSQPGAADLFNANVGPTLAAGASGLPPGFRAFIWVVAVNACGQSPPSATFVLQ